MLKNDQVYLVLDYETRSRCDLKRSGSWEYSVHPSTRILCVSWCIGTLETLRTAPVRIWSPALPNELDDIQELLNAFDDYRVLCVAQNALFEQVITKNVLVRYFHDNCIARVLRRGLPPQRWICTAALAAAVALPRNLEGACAVLKLPVQKDMEGHKLMMKMSKPRKHTKHNKEDWHKLTRKDLLRLLEYCKIDVVGARELLLTLPPLTPTERQVWELDQTVNLRGVKVDRDFVQAALQMVAKESLVLNQRTMEITGGALETTNKVAALRRTLKELGAELPNMQKKTIEDALAANLVDGVAKELLEIRLSNSKTSTAKYVAFESRTRSDSVLRDMKMYHGASTGRDTGTGVQIHNFPRGSLLEYNEAKDKFVPIDTWLAVELVRQRDLDLLRMLYGKPMDVFSSCLRSAITAREGNILYCGDYASIEVRVLFWMAKHTGGIAAYAEKRDLYVEMAKVIYGRKSLAEVTKPEREVGKRAILGCGYGMGAVKFFDTCKLFGQEVSQGLAKKAVAAYRETHFPIPMIWQNLERAAIAAVQNPGRIYAINHTKWFVKNDFLWCELPSGRRLAYHKPFVRMVVPPWLVRKAMTKSISSGELIPALHHYGVHPKTKQWIAQKTWGGVLTENVVQAVARDIMVEASLRLEKAGYLMDLSVHDELLTEKRGGSIGEFQKLMAQPPVWGLDIPIAVEAWDGPRYAKR